MLSLFRTNQLLASILLAFYILLVRGSVLKTGGVSWEPMAYGPFAEWVYGWVGSNGMLPDIIAMVLLLFQAAYINFMISEHRMADEVSLFPGLFYILVSSALPEMLHLSPALLANTFLIIVFQEVLRTYKKIDCANNIFNVGFWTGIAALFYPSFLVFFLFGLIALNLLRAFKFRERLMAFSGLLVPIILLSTYYFWTDQFEAFWQNARFGYFGFLDFKEVPIWAAYRSIGIFSVLILVVLFSYRAYLYKQTMQVQRKIHLLFWMLLASAFSLLIQADIQLGHLLITAFPIGVMLSFNFIKMPPRMAEVIHLLMLVGVLGLQLKEWFLPTL